MPVRITVDDALTIRKHIKNIGRAYQKRSVAMIQLCRLFLEISPGKTDQIDALRSIFEVVENALKLAVEAGKSRSQVADEAFATAEERLDRYAMDVHPTQESVVGDVHAVIEEAAQKDKDVMKTYSRITARVGFKKTDDPSSGSLIKVNFQILKSPTERGDAPIKTYEFGSGAGIPELLWTLNRLPEDQRVSLKQNPHFYSGSELSDKPSAYTDKFKLEPLRDLRLQEGSNILILLDRAGQIFLEHGRYSRTFGNLWRPGTAVILKDLQGTLEAAKFISPHVKGDVCIWHRGGTQPPRELAKWTDVLDQALLSPDADWLVRSETSLEDAITIELTGAWDRCRLWEPKRSSKDTVSTNSASSSDGDRSSTRDTQSLSTMSTSSLPGFNPPIPKLHPPLEATTSPSRPTDPRAMLKNATSEESRFPISYASPSIPDRPSSDGGRPYTEVIRPPSGSSHPVAEIARPRQGDSASAVSASVSSAADISPRRPKARLYVKKAVAPTQSRMAVGERAAGQFQTQERQLVVNGSIPASRARSEATASAVSHVEAAESSGIAAIPATASEDTSRSASSAATLILRASSSTVPTASTPTPRPTSKLSTKALINRHKPQAATVVPSHSISQSLDVETIPNSAVLDVLAPALVVTKADPSRIDSGIEIWDYESRQTTHSLAGTAHHRRRDPALSASPRASTSNIREGDGRPDPSALGGPPVSIPTHPDPRARRGESLIPTPSPVQPGSSWLPSTDVVETPTSSLPTSAPQGGFSPFISRKPQSNYQDPPQDPTNFAAHSLPPRSSTPSSMTGSHRPPTATSQNSSHHSTQTTVVTPATSFSMPSRESLQKPPPPPLQKSWFRRVVLDPVKSKLGMESS